MTPSQQVLRDARPVRRALATVLVGVLGGLTGLTGMVATLGLLAAGTASPASARVDACEFVALTDAEAVKARAAEADAVFYVRLRREIPATATTPQDRSDWAVRVIDGLAGDTAPADRTIRFDTSMVTRTRILTAGNDLVLFADDPADRPATGAVFDVDLCTGVGVPVSGALTLAERAQLTSVLEEGAAEEAEPEVPTVAYSDRDDRSVDLGRTIAPGAALILVGFLGLVLVSWAGRQRH